MNTQQGPLLAMTSVYAASNGPAYYLRHLITRTVVDHRRGSRGPPAILHDDDQIHSAVEEIRGASCPERVSPKVSSSIAQSVEARSEASDPPGLLMNNTEVQPCAAILFYHSWENLMVPTAPQTVDIHPTFEQVNGTKGTRTSPEYKLNGSARAVGLGTEQHNGD